MSGILLRVVLIIAVVLAGPYLLVKTGVWKRQPRSATIQQAGGGPERLPVIGKVKPFSMTNQDGETITLDDLKGKVWLADVMFTRCPGPCALMTQRLADLQQSIPAGWPVHFVSITADPDYDAPEVLRQYGTEFGADFSRWDFLHADKAAMVELVTGSLKLVVLDKEQERTSPNDLFIHSTSLAVVDQQGRLRGVVQLVAPALEEFPETTLDWDSDLKPRILQTVRKLLSEKL